MAVITTGQIVDFLDANLNEGWQDGLDRWPNEYDAIFNVQDSIKQSEKDSYESGFMAMPVKPEGAPAVYDSTIPGIKVIYTHVTYALNTKLGVLIRNSEVIKRAVSVEALSLIG